MSDELDGLKDAFFEALESRDLESCYQVLGAIKDLSKECAAILR